MLALIILTGQESHYEKIRYEFCVLTQIKITNLNFL